MIYFVEKRHGRFNVFSEWDEDGVFDAYEDARARADKLNDAHAARLKALDELSAESQRLGLYQDQPPLRSNQSVDKSIEDKP
jgi:hypothetical protein